MRDGGETRPCRKCQFPYHRGVPEQPRVRPSRDDAAGRRASGDRKKSDGQPQTGWRVHPAPDGRGAPPPPKGPKLPRLGWRFVVLVLALFAVNWWAASQIVPEKNPRVRIPFSPV